MKFQRWFPQFNSVSYEVKNSCKLTAIQRNFSSHIKRGSKFTEYHTDDGHFNKYFRPEFYANSDCRETESYVSIFFYGCGVIKNYRWMIEFVPSVEFNCTVAVLDAAGNKRFMQSFVYVFDPNTPRGLENGVPKFGFRDYIKREILCNDPSELLPDDCLTLDLEIDYVLCFYSLDLKMCVSQDTFVKDWDEYYFYLDSSFGRELSKVCDYFQRASDCPMIESRTRRVYFPKDELKAFHHINIIFMGASDLKIASIADVCEMYVVADKYGIKTVIETSRQLLKSFLCRTNDSNILQHVVECKPMILELAETYDDEVLKEMVSVYLKNRKKFETNKYVFKEDGENKLSTEWVCEFEKMRNLSFFKLSRVEEGRSNGRMKMSNEPEFEFYR